MPRIKKFLRILIRIDIALFWIFVFIHIILPFSLFIAYMTFILFVPAAVVGIWALWKIFQNKDDTLT